eukprot:jgi/Bigna1/90339/estExt_fgenesh1_pg.C_670102
MGGGRGASLLMSAFLLGHFVLVTGRNPPMVGSQSAIEVAPTPRILIVGGTGRIGTAAALHLLTSTNDAQERRQKVHITLAGRSPSRGRAAVREVLREAQGAASDEDISYVELDWRNRNDLKDALKGVAAVIHTAGPYLGEHPDVLKAAIESKVPVYVDVSDPVDYINSAKAMGDAACSSGTIALCSAGAFPGLSNVLAMECADRVGDRVKDIDFSYFTAGLGGSGEVNLLITNEGFGEPMLVFRNGKLVKRFTAGGDSRKAKFYIKDDDCPQGLSVNDRFGTGPFLKEWGPRLIYGNVILNAMVAIVPRSWWKSKAFSEGLARFSKPMVALTDKAVGETHAMRVDVTGENGRTITAVQAHESFRRVVGQSCAEFTLALLEVYDSDAIGVDSRADLMRPSSGVFTPEELFQTRSARKPVLKRLLSTPGTLNYGFDEGVVTAQKSTDR